MESGRHLGRYRLHEPIGQGGAARVWRATQTNTGRAAAVKVLTPASARRPTSAESIRRDIRFAGALLHPRIIFLYDHGIVTADEEDSALVAGSPWVAMALADGSVDRAMHRWSWRDVARALDQLLDGLAHAHARGVVHGDIKPQNLLLRDGDLLIADFGMAGLRRLAEEAGPRGGTPGFMAPELSGERSDVLGPWTDLYAVGATALSLVLHRPVPDGFAGWVARLMMPDPADRYRFACDAREGLARLGPAVAPHEGSHPARAAPTLDLFAPAEPALPEAEPAPLVRAPLPARPPGEPRVKGEAGGSLFGIRPPPLINRDAEREALWTLLRRVVSEQAPRMVWLDGPAGVGTSRLASWLLTAAHASGAGHVARIRFEGAGDADPLLDLLTDILACRHRSDRVARAVRRLGPPLHDDDVPFLRAWMAGRDTAASARRELVARAVAASTTGRVGMLAIDPGRAPDEADALARALLALPQPVLVVTEGVSHLRGERVHHLPIEPLSASHQHDLLQALVGELGEVPSWAVEATAGRPGSAVALARQWVRVGALPTEADTGRLPRWSERLAALGDDDQEALALAHMLGLPAATIEWQRACVHAGLEENAGRLGRLCDLGFVIDRGDRFELAHPMLSRAAEAHAELTSAALHRACALALEDLEAPSHRSVRHRVAAGDAAVVTEQLAVALTELVDRGRLRAARVLLDAAEAQLQPLEQDRSDPRWGDLALASLRLDLLGGRDAESLVRAREAARKAERYDWPTRVPLLNILGRLALDASNLEEARVALERALNIREHPLHTVVATNLAMVCFRAGEIASGLTLFDEAEATAISFSTLANAVRGRGMFLQRQGHVDEAYACYLRAHELYARDAKLLMMSSTANDLGEAERHRGHLPEARRWFERAIHIAAGLEVADRSFPTGNLALVLRAEGHEARADDLLRQAHEVCLGNGRSGPALLMDALRAPGALAARDWARLETHLASAAALLELGWRDLDTAQTLTFVAEACEERPDLAERARELGARHDPAAS